MSTATRSRATNPATGETVCQINEGDKADDAVEVIARSETIEQASAADRPGETAIVVCTVLPEAAVTILCRSFLIEKLPDADGTELRIAKHHGVLRAPLPVGRLSDRDEVDLGLE